jgi:hypothetical protein
VHFIVSSRLDLRAATTHVLATSPQVTCSSAAHAVVPAPVFVTAAAAAVAVFAVVAALVIWPAIWAKDATRREAAQNVLDRLLRALESTLKVIASTVRSRPSRRP